MAAQSTTCSSCQSAFSSYVQHSPFAALPPGKTPFQYRPPVEFVQANGNISVAPTKSLNDGSSLTSISCDLVPRNRKSSLTNKAAYAAAFDTGPSFTSLPTELMILIFLFACDDVQYWLTALALSVVSREFRSIAHALPELWTHITVDVRCPRPVEVVWWYLHLSRDAPLDVKINVIGDDESVGLLVQNATRWRRVDIRCMSQDLHIFKGIKKMGVPMLESLKLDVAESGWGMKRCKAFRDAPRLWEYAPWGVSPTECVAPWDRLKTVVLRDVCCADLTQYLGDAQTMEELVLYEEYFFGNAYGPGLLIPLSAKRLTMRSVPRLGSSVFLEALLVPYLTTADISIADWSTVDSRLIPSFIGMLKRSGCSLRELRLRNVPLDDEAILGVLACTPDLQALTVHEPAREHCITNAFLRGLVLPELRRLELVWSYDACEEHVMDMVERMKGLESVVLGRRFGLELSERTVERMNVLREGGVNVSQW